MKLTAERQRTLDLEVGPEEAMEACREALDHLGWEISEEEPGHLHGYEDFTRLNCRTSPSIVDLEVVAPDYDHTFVAINISAPGIGPVPKGRAERQLEALTRHIREAE